MAAAGMSAALYPKAQNRFCLMVRIVALLRLIGLTTRGHRGRQPPARWPAF